ncbi:Appr-1-p processing protein [Paenibacillus rhizoplanae]
MMGSGIAKILRDRYPNLYPEYKKSIATSTRQRICSDIASWCRRARSTRRICSASLTMEGAKTRYTDYAALEKALATLKTEAKAKGLSVALPYNIGCGLANGEWSVVERIIGTVFEDYEVTLYKNLACIQASPRPDRP